MANRNLWLCVCAGIALILAACSENTGSAPTAVPPLASLPEPDPPSPPPPPPPPPPDTAISITNLETEADAARFLARASFGGDKTSIRAMAGTNAVDWLEAEFAKPATLALPSLLAEANEKGEYRWNLLSDQYWDQMILSDDQLRQRTVFALSQILVVSDLNGGDQPKMAHYLDILSRNAFGNYRDLLGEITYSPAMAQYLTYFRNQKSDPRSGRMPDENYAREILQLFSIGLVELNMDGTIKRDANGREIETYTNRDVAGLARVFTGLAYKGDNFWEWRGEGDRKYSPLQVYPDHHETLEKSFLGLTIPANTPGDESIERALDHIFEHPNVAPFVARQLIQRFTHSSPSPAYIQRVAQAFEAGNYTAVDGRRFGTGVRGDLQATLAAVLLEEALYRTEGDDAQLVLKGKIREPVLRFVHWVRAYDLANISSANEGPLWNTANPGYGLAQHPLKSPSVFNFYRPGYIAPGTQSGAMDLTGPEFQIVNENSSIGYLNFMTDFISERTWQRDQEVQTFVPDYTEELALVDDGDALVDHLDLYLTGQRLTQKERTKLIEILETVPVRIDPDDPERAARDRLQKVQLAITLVVNSPSYAVTW
ncbi:MAG: DUF1800 family protein [Pseudomonadota bacterium]